MREGREEGEGKVSGGRGEERRTHTRYQIPPLVRDEEEGGVGEDGAGEKRQSVFLCSLEASFLSCEVKGSRLVAQGFKAGSQGERA